MWQSFKKRAQDWGLVISNPTITSKSDEKKYAHELRTLNLLLPTIVAAMPERVWRCESPDFKVATANGCLYVEVVDAVPDAISGSGTANLAERRSLENSDPYHVDEEQFGKVIADEIAKKRKKATEEWLPRKPALAGRLALLVNGGHPPLPLRDYFSDIQKLHSYISLTAIEPFITIVLGDETGAFVWGGVH